jgi:glycosyltransferase involved in cell wall biosynthesis
MDPSDPTQPKGGDKRPLRIGIWCIVQSPQAMATIQPNEGIGVFVYNLLGGLFAQPVPPEVVLMIQPSMHKKVTSTFKAQRPNLRVLPPPPPWQPPWKDPGPYIQRLAGKSSRIHHRLEIRSKRISELRLAVRGLAKQTLRRLLRTTKQHKLAMAPVMAVLLPCLLLAVWAAYAVYRFGMTAIKVLSAPLVWADQVLHYVSRHPRFAPKHCLDADLLRYADEADCDIWIVPSIHCNAPRHLPAVLFIHDLVTSHFPEIFDREFVDRVNRIAPRRAAEATLVACMSAFIRDTDLLGILKLPASKVRMVRSATPVDLPVLTSAQAQALKPGSLKRPYLFFPTAFRPYKNHRGLIKALRRLRDHYGNNEFDLVFTGGLPEFMPEDLQRLVDAYGFRGRIHTLGAVDRRTLACLYSCAFATLVPSLYEQASYQIAEGLYFKCPVACSHIPPFLEQCEPLGDAMVYFDPENPDSIARAILRIRDEREAIRQKQEAASQTLWQRTWTHVAAEWLNVFREGANLARQARQAEQREQAWAPAAHAAPADPQRLEVFLFLPTAYLGGIWEFTKSLVHNLVDINRQRRQLALVLGVHEDQADTAGLRRLGTELRVDKLRYEQFTLFEAREQLGPGFIYPDKTKREYFCYWNGQNYPALHADAWFALLDRFPLPLLPARPFGLWVYDMIQHHVPEFFGDDFFANWVETGMRPTIQNAAVVVVPGAATRDDVMAAYGMGPQRLRLVPLACEPHERFGTLVAEPVELPREQFLLYPANAGGHKGAMVLLRAYARLKERLGAQAPLLVQCGTNSDAFSSRYVPRFGDPPHWEATRKLVLDLELEEDRDVVFLGFVNDRQLLDLYQRCLLVINASKYDNGSYSLIEGRYFGRPLISTDYPAAVNLCQRFGLPAQFFPVDDDAALASQIHQAMHEPFVGGPALEEVRRRLADPEFSLRRHAERVYDLLVGLARQGREKRLARREVGVVPCRGEAA